MMAVNPRAFNAGRSSGLICGATLTWSLIRLTSNTLLQPAPRASREGYRRHMNADATAAASAKGRINKSHYWAGGAAGLPTQGCQTSPRAATKASATHSTVAPGTLRFCSSAFISAKGMWARWKYAATYGASRNTHCARATTTGSGEKLDGLGSAHATRPRQAKLSLLNGPRSICLNPNWASTAFGCQ